MKVYENVDDLYHLLSNDFGYIESSMNLLMSFNAYDHNVILVKYASSIMACAIRNISKEEKYKNIQFVIENEKK